MQKFVATVAFMLSLVVTAALTLGSYMAIYMFRHYVPVQEDRRDEHVVVHEHKAA